MKEEMIKRVDTSLQPVNKSEDENGDKNNEGIIGGIIRSILRGIYIYLCYRCL